jgi:hypothetical protein
MDTRFSKLGGSAAVAIGAGLASALLFSLVTQATVFAIALAYLSPLPIMIAMIGFGRAAGLTATGVAILAVFAIAFVQQSQNASGGGLAAASLSGATFALSLALPALWLSYLAALSRPKGEASWSIASGPMRTFARDGYPLERLLAYAVAISTTVAVIGAAFVSARHGGFESALNQADAALTPILESLAADMPLPHGIDLHHLARLMAAAAAPAVAASTLLMLLFNLWLAGRVAQLSERLTRPWPDIPNELKLSRFFAPVLLGAIGVAFAGGLPGVISATVAAALAMAFALQGLAVIHDISRGWKYRMLLLGLIYIGLLLLAPPWLLVAFAIIGLIESIFLLRDSKQNQIFPKP